MDLTHTLNPDNSSDALRLRKSENNLIIVGMGIMLFGLWNLTKTLSILFLNQSIFTDSLQKSFSQTDMQPSDALIFGVFAGIVIFSLIVGIIARFFIGFSAISVGRKKKNRTAYIPVSVLFLLISIVEIYYDISYSFFTEKDITLFTTDAPIVSVIIEFTSIIMIIELIISAFRVRSIRKKFKAEKGE